MGTHPARVGIGAETGMYGCNSGLIIWILQILKELTQLFDQEHTLVYNCAAAHGYHISVVIALLEDAACHIEATVKIQSLFHLCRFSDKTLHDVRHFLYGLITDLLRMGRKGSPAKELQSLFLYNHLQHFLCLVSRKFILGEEEHADTVFTGLAKLNAKRLCYLLEEFVGNLKHDADAISGLSFRVLAGAVFQVFYNMKCLLHGTVARDALDIGYSTDATVVMLKARIIKARSLCCRSRVFWGVC